MAGGIEPRSGIAGAWDRFVGPGQSRVEQCGTVGAVVAGALLGGRHLPADAKRGQRLLARVTAVDLWGGLWVNNTPSCVEWYERPGQGVVAHLRFASLHLLHVGAIGVVDTTTGSRSVRSTARWIAAHYGWMLASVTVTVAAPRAVRLPVAIAASAAGVGVDRWLGVSPTAPWFAPVYYGKLLIGHAAGSIWNR